MILGSYVDNSKGASINAEFNAIILRKLPPLYRKKCKHMY